MKYVDFLKTKSIKKINTGFDSKFEINKNLFDFQKAITIWAIRKGKAAIFADCGLGKTIIQLEWARHICKKTDGSVLILAPLAVSKQTKREGEKFGIDVNICRKQADVKKGINITNYEMLAHFDNDFSGVVLDESSILKSYSGKIRNEIIEHFKNVPFKLACTATPAPNDFMELGNHSEFLDVMMRTQMLATFFVHDGGETQKWRLKGHAEKDYWKWLCFWAVMLRKPSDLGFVDNGFILPELKINERIVKSDKIPGMLFAMEALTLAERRDARRASLKQRVELAANIANNTKESVLVWCDLNSESDALKKSIPGAVEVKGSDSKEHKENSMIDFANGNIRVLVSKPSICGYGMNFQNCSNMIFTGLSDSYEQYYQAVRRCWRFGQKNEVNVDIVISNLEGQVVENIKRKETDAEYMAHNMVEHMADISKHELENDNSNGSEYKTSVESGQEWQMYLGDSIDIYKTFDDNSIDFTIFSPPFAELYVYSGSDRDMGNAKDYDEFFVHFDFLVKELYRVTSPGRLVSIHCMDIPLMKERDGFIGLRNFSGDITDLMVANEFIYHGKHIIWKDPLIEATRTKALGLMHKQIQKDSAMCRAGLPDYLVTFRKPGENKKPIAHEAGFTDFIGENRPKQRGVEFSHNVWRRYASPVWMDINQSNTLQKASAREDKDEKHICPLQLDVIERALVLYSNEGDIISDPFTGIGSTGFKALKMNRRFIGCELKESYYNQAIKNLKIAENTKEQISIFDSTQ